MRNIQILQKIVVKNRLISLIFLFKKSLGFMVIGANGDDFEYKAPQNDKVFKIKVQPIDFYDIEFHSR